MNHAVSASQIATAIEAIKVDYARFPKDQNYDLYAEDVYFKDPMNEFRGVDRYRHMINFIQQWFRHIELTLHTVEHTHPDLIVTRWTLHFTAPVPWQPRISIPGWSELQLNGSGLICAHVDYWHCSRWAVLKQVFSS